MVHSYLTRIFSLRPSESQMVTVKQVMPLAAHHPQEPNMSSAIKINNNNKEEIGESPSSSAHDTRWSAHNNTWTWSPSQVEGQEDFHCSPSWRSRKLFWLIGGVISVILVITVIVAVLVYLLGEKSDSEISNSNSMNQQWTPMIPSQAPTISSKPTGVSSGFSRLSDSELKKLQQERRKASKLSWDMLNRSDKQKQSGSRTLDDGDEVILPAQMVFTSTSGGSVDDPTKVNGQTDPNGKARSCCRTQKYTQVIRRDGCEPVTIVNRMCFGQCVSVWVPGLFASFPVCKPSRSTWKTVTLTCGKKRERRKRVKVERVKRCSCMEIEPTPSSSL